MYGLNTENVIVVKATASRYTYVIENSPSDYHCPDAAGGYGTGNSPEVALRATTEPYLYRTKKAAMAAALGEE